MKVSADLWAQLVAAFEEAERKSDAALLAYDEAPLPANEEGAPSPEEKAWETASQEEAVAEDRLLGLFAPHVQGAALQLRLFARRHHSVDLRRPPDAPEDREAAILRCIYAGLAALEK